MRFELGERLVTTRSLLVLTVMVLCMALVGAVPLESPQELGSRRGSLAMQDSFKVAPRMAAPITRGVGGSSGTAAAGSAVFDLVHDCQTNSTLSGMCTQCAGVAKNAAETFLRCCANRQRVRDWCIDFINYIIN